MKRSGVLLTSFRGRQVTPRAQNCPINQCFLSALKSYNVSEPSTNKSVFGGTQVRGKIVCWSLLFSLVTLWATYLSPPASASSSGISGFSGKNGSTCTSCHFGGIQPMVTLTGPTSVNSGSTNTYTLTITGGQATRGGGLDVAASPWGFAVLLATTQKTLNQAHPPHQ